LAAFSAPFWQSIQYSPAIAFGTMAIPLRFPAVAAFVGFDSSLGPVAVSCGLPHPAAKDGQSQHYCHPKATNR
jgi:hypothetical protein